MSDQHFFFIMLLAFARASAMLLTAPFFASGVPIQVRLYFAGILSAVTVNQIPNPPEVPSSLFVFAAMITSEIACGLLLGFLVQLLLLAFQTAGSFLDTQLGLNTMQLFNPSFDSATTLLGQYKYMLGLVVYFLLDGHHQLIQGFWLSYQQPFVFAPDHMLRELFNSFGRLSMLSLQMAAPAAASTLIVDAAAGFVNKSIPQMQVYFLTAGLKTIVGVGSLAIALPLIISAVRGGIEFTTLFTQRIFGWGL